MSISRVTGPDADLAIHAVVFDEVPAACRLTVTAWALLSNTAVRRARSLLRSQVIGHIKDQNVLDDVDLMVSELGTNAAIHGDGPYEMRLLHHADVPMVCEIADTGGGLDEIATHLRRNTGPVDAEQVASIDALQTGGRGLGVLAHLSGGRCGVRTTRLCSTGQPGKSVWFAIPGVAHLERAAQGPGDLGAVP